ncbi:MAG: hypothetical protein AB7K24_21490 [Gemmataceae bacterium]
MRIVMVACLLLLGGSGYLFYLYGEQSVRVAAAHASIEIFERLKDEACTEPPGKAVDKLVYIRNYYPSGSRQRAGSRLDEIVEHARRHALRDIILHLQKIAPRDLGDDPEVWIREYSKSKPAD